MAIPNTYWWHRGAYLSASGTPAVYELVNGSSLSLIGDSDIGDGLEAGFIQDVGATNRICEYKGKRYLWHENFIKEENEGGTGNWGTVHTTSQPAGASTNSGLFTVILNGDPIMVGMSGLSIRCALRFDGTTFTNIVPGGGTTIRAGTATVFNNKIYWNVYNQVWTYDPVDDSIAVFGMGGSFSTITRDFAVVNNRLFLAGYQNSSGVSQFARLWVLDDTGFTIVYTFDTDPIMDNGFSGASGNPLLFSPDNSSLVFITTGEDGSNNVGDQAALIQNPGTGSQIVTDITDPLIPSQFRPLGADAVGTARYFLFTDTQNSSSPTSPDFYIWRLADQSAGSYGFYQYVDTSTVLSYLGIGPSHQYWGPHIKNGGQDRISAGANSTSTNKIYTELENPVIGSSIGTMDISFRVYGSDTGLDGRVYMSLDQETPDTQITITSVTGGSTSVASNVISNITADDGATLYTLTWPATADGVTDGVPVTLVMDLAT